MIETGWVSILPPLIAIVLALVTKEVYSSLFLGVLSGMVIFVSEDAPLNAPEAMAIVPGLMTVASSAFSALTKILPT